MKNESTEHSGELGRAPESSEVGARRDKIRASHANSTSVDISRRNYVGQNCLLCCFFLSSSLGNKTVADSNRSCISSASFGIQII
jgi:hypothetical protein